MINLMYLVFIAMMALNVSSEVLDGFELVEGSLRTSIDNTSTRNEIVTEELKAYYQTNPEKVREWYEKGDKGEGGIRQPVQLRAGSESAYRADCRW